MTEEEEMNALLSEVRAHREALSEPMSDVGAYAKTLSTQIEAMDPRCAPLARALACLVDNYAAVALNIVRTAPPPTFLLPAGLMVRNLQSESYQTAVEKGWHDEDDDAPSDAVAAVAAEGLRIWEICRNIERIRNGLPPEPGAGEGPQAYYLDKLDALDAKQIRTLAWLALVDSEVAEAADDVLAKAWELKVAEDGKATGLPSEVADIYIRCGDMAGALGVDLEPAIRAKLRYNRLRSRRHGGKKV